MAHLTRFRRLLVYVGVYTVGLLIEVVAFAVPYWEVNDESSRGLWMVCHNGSCFGWRNEKLMYRGDGHHLPPDYYVVSQAMMSMCLVLTLLAGATFTSWITQHKDHKLMIVTTSLLISSAVACIIEIVIFGIAFSRNDSKPALSLGWGFWCLVVATIVLAITSVILFLDRCVIKTDGFEHSMVAYQSKASIMRKAEYERRESAEEEGAEINQAYSNAGSTNGISRPPTISTIATLGGRQSSSDLNSAQGQNYMLPTGLKPGIADAQLGVAPSAQNNGTAQPWTAGAGQLF